MSWTNHFSVGGSSALLVVLVGASATVFKVETAILPGSQGSAAYTEIVTRADYQEDNLLTSLVDGEARPIDLAVPEAAGRRPDLLTTFRYDAAGRLAGTRSGQEGERQRGYDVMSRAVVETDGDEGVWRGRYDAWGRLFHEEQPNGAVVRRRFDRAHQPVEEQVFSADPLAVPDAELLARTLTRVTSFGTVERTIEELTESGERLVTEQLFDGSGRTTAIWSGPEGEPERVDPARGRRELAIEYEPASGRVLARRHGGDATTGPLYEEILEYGAESRLPWPVRRIEREAVPGQAELVTTFVTSFERDVLGRVLAATRSDGERQELVYDRGSADVLRSRTGAGTEQSMSRDGRGLPVVVTRPSGRGHDRFTYDTDGLPLRQVTASPDGTALWETSTSYDATGRVAAVDFADGTREERSYHPDSALATLVARDGVTLAFTYDAANRLSRVTPTAGPGPTLVDAGDELAYDELSRPTLLARGRPGVAGLDAELSVAYPGYDLGSRPAAEVVGTRAPLAWSYDAFSRPVEVELPAGPGREPGGAWRGFARGFDTLDRLSAASGLGAAGLSPTPAGADWSWGGADRLYGVTTRGVLGTASRFGYHGGAGPQLPDAPAGADAAWKLGRMAWGAAGGAGGAVAPATGWGDFGFGWRGRDGSPSDGAKVGRQALAGSAATGLLSGLGWSWGYDAGVRLSEAVPWSGDLEGRGPPAESAGERFTFLYGEGDELLERAREATGEIDLYTAGPYGRPTSVNGHPFTHDAVGRRLEDDRFVYRWDWRGQLVSVAVKDSWPDTDGDDEPEMSPYAGHHLRYDYDALGRLTRRLHEGVAAADGTRPFIEERHYVWEGDRLAAEAAYGAPGATQIRWRRTYVPGPTGLDDPAQVIVEIHQPGSPWTGTARTYTYVTDELGTVVALVAEDEAPDPARPPVPVRYRYTPYGAAHPETAPELLRARFDGGVGEVATAAGVVAQEVADETAAAPGAMVLDWSLPLDAASLGDHLVVEQLLAPSGWTGVPADQVAVGKRQVEGTGTGGGDGAELLVLLTNGWERGRSYRIRLEPALVDRLGRGFGRSESLEWSVPVAKAGEPLPALHYDRRFPPTYESWQAAAATLGDRFPAGQSRLFQGLWTDPVTGLSYARARWYDPGNGSWLAEDPLVDVDSPNLYAFVGWQPTMGKDPSGEAAETIVDAISLTIGVVSLGHNLKEGNWGAVALDTFGVAVDAVATAIPFLPGGAGLAIKAGRAATKGADALSTVRRAQLIDQSINVGQGMVQAAEAYEEGETLTAAFYGGMSALGARGVAKSPYRFEARGLGAATTSPKGTAVRDRVVSNVAESRAARNASHFKAYAQFDRYFAITGRVDVTSAHSRAVFYSGHGNRARALAFAERTGRTPIDFTPGGKYLESLDLYSRLPSRRADLIWARASERYAAGASGEVNLFIKGARPDRTYRLVEERILKDNLGVYKWIFRGY